MRPIFRFLLPLVVAVAIASPARAQEDVLYPFPDRESPYRLGIELGANYSLFSRSIAFTPFDNPTSPNHVIGSGSGLGGFVDIAASRDLGERLRVYARAGVEFVRIVSSGDAVVDLPSSGNFFDTTAVSFKRSSSTYFFTGELGLQYDFFERDRGLYGSLGLVDHRWGGSTTTTNRFELPAAGGRTFPNGTTVNETTADDTTSFEQNRLGLHIGLGWQLPITDNLILAPELSFHYMFGAPFPDQTTAVDDFRHNTLGDLEVSTDNAALHYLRFGLGLWWRL